MLDIAGEEITTIRTGDLLLKWLRHTAVTELSIAGNDAPAISQISGHSIKTCENIINRYVVPANEAAAEAMNKRLAFERSLNESWNSNS